MKIKLFVTGGTIDATKILKGKKVFHKTYITKMLRQARSKANINVQVLMMKLSYLMSNEDRNMIMKACKDCVEKNIIISHGTDTMVETAKLLGKNIHNKTIVLTGAITPYNKANSDALFNLGCAVAAVQLLPNSVYITMNGKIFKWDNVVKDKKSKIFRTKR